MSWNADWFVTCDACHFQEWMDGSTKKQAMKTARELGWKISWTKATCPECVIKQLKVRSLARARV